MISSLHSDANRDAFYGPINEYPLGRGRSDETATLPGWWTTGWQPGENVISIYYHFMQEDTMSVETPTSAQPVGHQGARVEITQRPALAVNGWLGVVVLAGCVTGMVLSGKHDRGLLWLPLVVFVLIVTSLVIVTPGQTSVIQFSVAISARSAAQGFGGLFRLQSVAGSAFGSATSRPIT